RLWAGRLRGRHRSPYDRAFLIDEMNGPLHGCACRQIYWARSGVGIRNFKNAEPGGLPLNLIFINLVFLNWRLPVRFEPRMSRDLRPDVKLVQIISNSCNANWGINLILH